MGDFDTRYFSDVLNRDGPTNQLTSTHAFQQVTFLAEQVMPRNRNVFGCHVELIDFC